MTESAIRGRADDRALSDRQAGRFGLSPDNRAVASSTGSTADTSPRSSSSHSANSRRRAAGAELAVPLFHFETLEQCVASIPVQAHLVCVELTAGALDIRTYEHPARAVYLLGPEDGALPASIMRQHDALILPGAYPMNVAMAATAVLYDRLVKVGAEPR